MSENEGDQKEVNPEVSSSDAEILKELGKGLTSVPESSGDSVGRDLHIICKELTNDANAYRFANVKKREVPEYAFRLACSNLRKFWSEESVRLEYRRPRYFLLELWNFYQAVLSQAIDGAMADRYKDQSGYILAFRGGIEWRQAGIMSDSMMADEKAGGLLSKLKKG